MEKLIAKQAESNLTECGNSCRPQKQEYAMTQKQQIENHGDLSGKRIVVLGGSSGIGLAVAQQMVAQGATAIIASSNADRVKQAVATFDGKVEGHALDLSNERDIQNFFHKIGDFDHLVFTAGDTLQLNELAATDLTKARHAFELRYWAALAAVKYASPHIRKDGSIVLTTGVAGQRPHKGGHATLTGPSRPTRLLDGFFSGKRSDWFGWLLACCTDSVVFVFGMPSQAPSLTPPIPPTRQESPRLRSLRVPNRRPFAIAAKEGRTPRHIATVRQLRSRASLQESSAPEGQHNWREMCVPGIQHALACLMRCSR